MSAKKFMNLNVWLGVLGGDEVGVGSFSTSFPYRL
jgi:hypothetical protein